MSPARLQFQRELADLEARALGGLDLVLATLDQVVEAHTAGATRVLLDNMTPEQVREAVLVLEGVAEVEISGGPRCTGDRLTWNDPRCP